MIAARNGAADSRRSTAPPPSLPFHRLRRHLKALGRTARNEGRVVKKVVLSMLEVRSSLLLDPERPAPGHAPAQGGSLLHWRRRPSCSRISTSTRCKNFSSPTGGGGRGASPMGGVGGGASPMEEEGEARLSRRRPRCRFALHD